MQSSFPDYNKMTLQLLFYEQKQLFPRYINKIEIIFAVFKD